MPRRNATPCLLLLVFVCSFVILIQTPKPTLKFGQSVESDDEDAELLRSVTEALNRADSKNCMDLAIRFAEPYTHEYQNQTVDPNGPMHAYYRWKRPIQKYEIDAQKTVNASDCRMVFKVKDRSLYVYRLSECYSRMNKEDSAPFKFRYDRQVELILLALEIYDVPDADFVVELEDGTFPTETRNDNVPGLSYCIPAGVRKNSGFTYPSYGAYSMALGRQQMKFFQTCQRIRYPFSERTPKAVWRGSTTGPRVLNEATDVYANRRISLAHIATYVDDILDAGIVSYVQINESDSAVRNALRGLAPIRDRLSFEQYNSYAATIDMDGNAWSDRLPALLMSATPVLKQEYDAWIEYFAHLLTEKEVTFFKSNLSDIVKKTSSMLLNYKFNTRQWRAQIARSNEFAVEHLSHLGVIRAMAYAIAKQASLQEWNVTMESGYIQIPRAVCCHLNPSLPKELLRRMKSKPIHQ